MGVSAIQFHLGMALHRAGRLAEALAMYEGALASVRDVGPANTVQYALAGAGHVPLLLGDLDRAAQLFAESHAVARNSAPTATRGQRSARGCWPASAATWPPPGSVSPSRSRCWPG